MIHPLLGGLTMVAVLAMVLGSMAMAEDAPAPADPDPQLEAALPTGFPAPGPLNEITIKDYPAYRAAWHDKGEGFWSLFRHIKKNEVNMTAPVEMTIEEKQITRQGKRLVISSQAFMYERPDQGATGQQGDVIVRDMPAQTVISIAVTGKINQKRMDELLAKLQAELEKRKGEYESAGPSRMLGYHSPFVPAERRWTEFQIPIKKVEPKSESEAKPQPETKP